MTQPLGEEFINIRPSLQGFRAELNAQIAAALQGVAPQIAAAQRQLTRGTGTATLAGLPAASAAQTRLAIASTRTANAQRTVAATSQRLSGATQKLSRDIQTAETATGRFTRGTVAATAASTGLFRAVSFASGAFLVGALAGGAIGAAVQEFKQMTIVGAQTAAILRATGGAAGVTAKQIDALATSQLKLTGTDDELVKQAADVLLTFRAIRNEAGAGNDVFTRSVKAVQDISAVFGTQLTGSAIQLGKALQDPIRGVTALRRSGITLSQSQRDLIKRLVETGRILTAQKVILNEVERQVGGTAAAVGRTLPGRLAIMRESAKNALGEFVKRISESQKATQGFTQTTAGLSDAIKGAASALAVLVGPVALIGRALGDLLIATGGLRVLVRVVGTAAAVFGTLKLALFAASAAQRSYIAFTTAATVATAAQGAAAATAATRISFGAAVLGAAKGPLGITVAITAALIGLQKLKAQTDKMPGSFSAAKRALDDLGAAIDRVSGARTERAAAGENVSIARINQIAAQRRVDAASRAAQGAAPGSVARAGFDAQLVQARIDLRKATAELTTAQGKYADSVVDVTTSEKGLIEPLSRGTDAWLARFRALRQVATAQLRPQAIQGPGDPAGRFRITPANARAVQAEIQRANQLNQAAASQRAAAVRNALELARTEIGKLAESGNATDRVFARVVDRILDLNRLPTEKQLNVTLSLLTKGQSTKQILAALGFGLLDVPRPASPQLQVNANAIEAARAATALVNFDRKRLRIAEDVLTKLRQQRDAQREVVASAKQAVQAAQDARQSAIEGLNDAIRGIADARQRLADTIIQSNKSVAEAIRASRQAVTDAIQSAKANLTSLGQTAADILEKFFAAGGDQTVGGNLGRRFQELRAQIIAGGGGADTRGAATRIAFRVQQQVPQTTRDIRRQFDDLTDSLERGKISLPQFNQRLKNLLGGVNLGQIRKTLGSSVANAFQDAIRDIRAQARAVQTGPRRPGGSVATEIVKPLNAVAKASRDIAEARNQATKDNNAARRDVRDALDAIPKAQKDIQRANQNLADAQKKLQEEQKKETKLNTKAVNALTVAVKRGNKLEEARQARDAPKPKPKGAAGKNAADQTQVGTSGP